MRDAADARLPDRGRDASTTCSRREPVGRAHESTCARTSRARCAAPTRSTTRCSDAAGDDPRLQRARVRVPRRVRHRADGVGRRRLRRPARARGRAARSSTTCAAGARRCCRTSSCARASRDRGRHGVSADDRASSSRTSTSRASTRSSLRAPRRLRDAAQGARDGARGRCCRSCSTSGLRGRGGAGFAMGKKVSFLPQGRRWTSTSSATRTSPSRAPSRTAS